MQNNTTKPQQVTRETLAHSRALRRQASARYAQDKANALLDAALCTRCPVEAGDKVSHAMQWESLAASYSAVVQA